MMEHREDLTWHGEALESRHEIEPVQPATAHRWRILESVARLDVNITLAGADKFIRCTVRNCRLKLEVQS